MAVIKLTQDIVDSEKWSGKTRFVRDADTRGLILAVNRHSKTWKVQRDLWRSGKVKTIRQTLGNTDELSLKDARTRALEVITLIRRGIDPNEKTQMPPSTRQSCELKLFSFL